MVRLFIDAGRTSGIGPGDIVGAIANEADVPGKAIGAIDISDRFTFLEVPAEYRDRIRAHGQRGDPEPSRPREARGAPPRTEAARRLAGRRKRVVGKPFRKAGNPPFKGRAASRRRKGKSKGKGREYGPAQCRALNT
jgi:hypothetical protein